MATTKTRPRRSGHARPPTNRWGPQRLWMAGLGLVIALGVVAVVASAGSNRSSAGRQTRPVAVTDETLPARPDSGIDPAIGRTVPELDGAGFDGSPVAVRLDGKPKIMLFVAHWCPHCQVEIPRLAGWLSGHALPGDVELVTVSTGVEANRPNYPPSTWLEREGWTYPTLADSAAGDAAKAYGLSAFPYFVVVDKDGRVVARDTGELSTGQFSALVDLARGA